MIGFYHNNHIICVRIDIVQIGF